MKKDRWEARVSDLEPGDRIEIMCDRCGHESTVDAEVFIQAAKSDPKTAHWRAIMTYTRVLDLKGHVRCTRCPRPLNGRPHREYNIRVLSIRERKRD